MLRGTIPVRAEAAQGPVIPTTAVTVHEHLLLGRQRPDEGETAAGETVPHRQH